MIRITTDRGLAYETDLPVKVGDRIEVPKFWWAYESWGPNVQTVVALGSGYSGPCKRVLRILEQAS